MSGEGVAVNQNVTIYSDDIPSSVKFGNGPLHWASSGMSGGAGVLANQNVTLYDDGKLPHRAYLGTYPLFSANKIIKYTLGCQPDVLVSLPLRRFSNTRRALQLCQRNTTIVDIDLTGEKLTSTSVSIVKCMGSHIVFNFLK